MNNNIIQELLKKSKYYMLLDLQEKQEFFELFEKNVTKIDEDTIFSIILNIRTPFFEEFDENLINNFIDIILKLEFKSIITLSSYIEYLGVIFKACTMKSQMKIYKYIIDFQNIIKSNPSTIIAFCNFIWFTFTSLSNSCKYEIYSSLKSLSKENKYPFLYDTIDYTLQQIKAEGEY